MTVSLRPSYALEPVTLTGSHVVLVPLSMADLEDLLRLDDDPTFRILLRPPVGPGVNPGRWLETALSGVARGDEAAWIVRDKETGQLLGSTRYLGVDLHNLRLEIGSTWFVSSARGTVANVESKLLLLTHAFEMLKMRRIHIQADVRNERSRASIAALGATFEGVLRRHIVLADGSSRDTAVYSILLDEWMGIRSHIQARARRKYPTWRSGDEPMSAGPSMLEAV